MRLFELSATALRAAYESGALSPVEVMRAVLDRVAAFEPAINALYLPRPEKALAAAEASLGRWRARQPLSPLDGVPLTIKSNVATAGDPTPVGTAALDDLDAASEDAPPAARAREAGCVLFAKTTMPDLGMLSSGLSSLHGITRNPWDLGRNPSGSSSGAGAGIAAGYGPLAIGTDIGGSVRLPAAHCGHVALKPSLGRIPIHPPYFGRVAGPMTRTVADAAMLLTVLSPPDPRDHMSLPFVATDYAADLDALDVRGLKLGLMLDAGCGTAPIPEVREAVLGAAALFAREGAEVTPVPPIGSEVMAQGLDLFFRARSLLEVDKLPDERRRRLLPFILDWCEAARGRDALDLMAGFQQIFVMREAAVRATAPFAFLLTPTSPIEAYEAELPCPGADPARPFEHIAFTAPFNFSEQPALSIPCGVTTRGLPIGLQIVGHRFDDRGVLRLARAYERLRQPMPAWPEPPAASDQPRSSSAKA